MRSIMRTLDFPIKKHRFILVAFALICCLLFPASAPAMGGMDLNLDLMSRALIDANTPEAPDAAALIPILVNNRHGAINGKGEIIIKPMFGDVVYMPSLKIAMVKHENKYGIMDMRGKWLARPAFDDMQLFSPNGLAPAEKGDAWGIINTRGEWVVEPRFETISRFGANNLAFAKTKDKKGYIDAKGEWRVAVPDDVKRGERFAANGLAVAESSATEGKKYGYINTAGAWAIKPAFKEAYPFAPNGLAIVTTDNDLFGAINEKGGWVIPPKQKFMGSFTPDGIALATRDNTQEVGFMDAKGQWRIEPSFSHDDWLAFSLYVRGMYASSMYYFSSNGLAKAYKDKKAGFINAKGKWVIDPQYDGVTDFTTNGLALVTSEGKSMYIDENTMPVVSIEKICDTEIVKNEDGNLIWPVGKTIAQICADQEALKRHAEAEKAKKENKRPQSVSKRRSF